MKGGNDANAIHIDESAAQFRNRCWRLEDRLRGKRSETADDFRANDGKLLFQKWITRSDFVRLGISIVRRPALQDVADVNIFSLEIDRLDNFRQQLPGASNKRQTLLIFVVSGASPTKTSSALGLPEPKTMLVRFGASLQR
jgi:hypothetical protein